MALDSICALYVSVGVRHRLCKGKAVLGNDRDGETQTLLSGSGLAQVAGSARSHPPRGAVSAVGGRCAAPHGRRRDKHLSSSHRDTSLACRRRLWSFGLNPNSRNSCSSTWQWEGEEEPRKGLGLSEPRPPPVLEPCSGSVGPAPCPARFVCAAPAAQMSPGLTHSRFLTVCLGSIHRRAWAFALYEKGFGVFTLYTLLL